MTLSKVDLKLDPNSDLEADDADLRTHVAGLDRDRVAYVVRAVNAHADLVRLLRAFTVDPSGDSMGDMVRFGQAYDDACKLLASLD